MPGQTVPHPQRSPQLFKLSSPHIYVPIVCIILGCAPIMVLLETLELFTALNAPSPLMFTGSEIISPKRDHPPRDSPGTKQTIGFCAATSVSGALTKTLRRWCQHLFAIISFVSDKSFGGESLQNCVSDGLLCRVNAHCGGNKVHINAKIKKYRSRLEVLTVFRGNCSKSDDLFFHL